MTYRRQKKRIEPVVEGRLTIQGKNHLDTRLVTGKRDGHRITCSLKCALDDCKLIEILNRAGKASEIRSPRKLAFLALCQHGTNGRYDISFYFRFGHV